MSPSEKVRALLDERGIEYGSGFGGDTLWTGRDGIEWRWDKQENILAMYSHTITPEQAIAATVGNGTDLSKRLREVHGLHAFAELFGFSWTDESDWDWHDVACAMADAIDATVGEESEMHICKRCGVAYELNIIDEGFGKPRFCPNCGFRLE